MLYHQNLNQIIMNENPELIPTANPVPDAGGPALKVCPECKSFPDYMYNTKADGTAYHFYFCRNRCIGGLSMGSPMNTELEARESWNSVVDQLSTHVELS